MTKFFIIIGCISIIGIAGFFLYRAPAPKTIQPLQTNDIFMSDQIKIQPIEHATAVITFGNKVIYTDPLGGAAAFAGMPAPDLILLTDIHSDHLSIDTIEAVVKADTLVVAPNAVAEQLLKASFASRVSVLANGESKTLFGDYAIMAVPMYNEPASPSAFHTKGRGNGYIVEYNGTRLYVSGDTGNTPELRGLQNIDVALLSMNLPYTMSVEDAALATLAFKPKQIIPYHYRGNDGLSDIQKFKTLVEAGDQSIKVTLLDWYSKK